MKAILYAAALALSLSSTASLAYEHIKDPKHLLTKLDAFMDQPAFDKAFPCGRTLIYQFNKCARFCEPFSCSEVCDPSIKESRIQIRDCKKDSVTVFNLSENREWFRITPESFRTHNFIRFVLAAPWIGKPGKSIIGEDIGKNRIDITGLKPETFKSASGVELPAMRLFFTYFHHDSRTQKEVPSAQSLLMPKFAESGGLHLDHVFYELKRPMARVSEILD
ncbi:MAG TPA: hypothetical protein VM901_12180 [Bdellovibrionota bacterium]|jgi:hypothetical protein|nr:hypothetical protein [Bdellovibrionota bacterium]